MRFVCTALEDYDPSDDAEDGRQSTGEDEMYAVLADRFATSLYAMRRQSTVAAKKRQKATAVSLVSRLASAVGGRNRRSDEKTNRAAPLDTDLSEASGGSGAEDASLVATQLESMSAAALTRHRDKRQRTKAQSVQRRASVRAELSPQMKKYADEVAMLEGWADKRSHSSNGLTKLLYQRRYFCVEQASLTQLHLTWRRKFGGEKVGAVCLATTDGSPGLVITVVTCAEPLSRDATTGLYDRAASWSNAPAQGSNVLYLREAGYLRPERRRLAEAQNTLKSRQFEPFMSDDEFPDAPPNELRVGLVRGAGLAAVNSKSFFGSGPPGTSDPRVKFSIVGSASKDQPSAVSKTMKRTLDPHWQETFELALDPPRLSDDSDLTSLPRFALIACCEHWDEISAGTKMGFVAIDLDDYARRSRRDRAWHELRPDAELDNDMKPSSFLAPPRRKKGRVKAVSGGLELVVQSRYSERRAAHARGGLSRDLELRFDSVDALLRWANALQRVCTLMQNRDDSPASDLDDIVTLSCHDEAPSRDNDDASPAAPPSEDSPGAEEPRRVALSLESAIVSPQARPETETRCVDDQHIPEYEERREARSDHKIANPVPPSISPELVQLPDLAQSAPEVSQRSDGDDEAASSPAVVTSFPPLSGWLTKRSPTHRRVQRRFCALERSTREPNDEFDLSWRRTPSGPRLSVLALRRGMIVLSVVSATQQLVFNEEGHYYEHAHTVVDPAKRVTQVPRGEEDIFTLQQEGGSAFELLANDAHDLVTWANAILAVLS